MASVLADAGAPPGALIGGRITTPFTSILLMGGGTNPSLWKRFFSSMTYPAA
jgi:hypothetical protein